MENHHRNSGFTQLKNGGSFHNYASLPEGIVKKTIFSVGKYVFHWLSYSTLHPKISANFSQTHFSQRSQIAC